MKHAIIVLSYELSLLDDEPPNTPAPVSLLSSKKATDIAISALLGMELWYDESVDVMNAPDAMCVFEWSRFVKSKDQFWVCVGVDDVNANCETLEAMAESSISLGPDSWMEGDITLGTSAVCDDFGSHELMLWLDKAIVCVDGVKPEPPDNDA